MADNKKSINKKQNITGSYPGVTGSYRRPAEGQGRAPAQNPQQKKPTRTEALKKQSEKPKSFDFKLWFSQDNVKAFLKQLRYYGIIVLVSLLLTAGIVNIANDVFAFIKTDESIVVNIPQGGTTKQISAALKQAGVINNPMVFRFYCKLKKADGTFQYGDYTLNSNLAYDQIISKLKKASVQAETFTVTVPDGMTQDEIAQLLTSGKHVNATDIEHALNTYEYDDFEFLDGLPKRRCRLEGYLPGGEYEFYKGESAVSMVSKMLSRFEETVLTDENKKLIEQSGKKLDEIINIASLIQKECGDTSAYKTAASVIFNRLDSEKNNFLKLSSPINYVLASKKTVFAADDKKTESEYNTYIYSGLPKGPICNPTLDAIQAVLSPESSGYVYFISDGKKVTFSTSESEHRSNLDKASSAVLGTDAIK